jgi:hypothetical protein
MDLYAYTQIENLEEILEKMNIEIPRLRGLRLMKVEEPITDEKLKKALNENLIEHAEFILTSDYFDTGWWSHTYPTPPNKKKYIVYDKDEKVVAIRWDKLHGKKRKQLKYMLKQYEKAFWKQMNMFNSFCGKDVLYVHARIGGSNWNYYQCDYIIKYPQYLDRCNDYWDCTYCDIYFDISEVKDYGSTNTN